MAAGLGSACGRLAVESGLPGLAVPARVIGPVAERSAYLDAEVEAGGQRQRFFFPADERCRAVLAARELHLALSGALALLGTVGESCPAVGILSLRAWRDRQGRAARAAAAGSPVPAERVEYRVIYVDPEMFLARGRFPTAAEIGWRGWEDAIAVFENSPTCRGVREGRRGKLEYRSAGPTPFSVVSDSGRCPVLGFAQVLGEP